MLDTAIVGLGWWGKTLVKAARDARAPIRFVRGVTLEPETTRDFAAEHNISIGTSFDDVLHDPQVEAVILATPHSCIARRSKLLRRRANMSIARSLSH